MKIIWVLIWGILLSVKGNAQEDKFLEPIGKDFSEYKNRITCVAAGYEFGESYTDRSICSSYRLNSSDSFRIGNVTFYILFFHRDSGRIITNLSYDKTIKDEKRSRQVKRANDEFRRMTEYLDKYCRSEGVVRHNLPPVKDQKYKITDWNKGSFRFTLQQVDVKNVKIGNGFSTLSLWIGKLN